MKHEANGSATLSPRIDIQKAAPEALKVLLQAHIYLESCGLEESLLHMIYLRASQINGCAFCVDMHWKDARAVGVDETKLSLVCAWREAPFFTERERAALEWTETVTNISSGPVPDSLFRVAREQFTEPELANLTVAIGVINTWNRLNVSFQKPGGSYQPSMRSRLTTAAQATP